MELKEKLKETFGFSKKIEKWRARVDLIETKTKQAFVEGSNSAAENFLSLNADLLKQIETLRRDHITEIEKIHNEHADELKKVREQHSITIKELENAHDTQCKFCRASMESERMRFKSRQMFLAEIINKVELLWQKMRQHSGDQVKLAESIVTASAQLASSKTEYVMFGNELDKIMKEAQPLLNMELQDGSVDKYLVLEKALDQYAMKDAPKQIEKKKDGGLI